MTKEYIAYQGEQPIAIGTIKELSEKLEIPEHTLLRRSYPSIQNVLGEDSIKVYKIKDDEDDS